MANAEHTDLTSASVHEPKHITNNGTGASGQVITNSSTVNATSEYRSLVLGDLNEVEEFITFTHPDGTSTETHFLVSPVAGTLRSVRAIIDNPVVTADLVYTFAVNGTNLTPATMTFTLAGTAQGESQELVFSSGNTLAAGDSIEIDGNGGNTDATVSTYFVFTIRRA